MSKLYQRTWLKNVRHVGWKGEKVTMQRFHCCSKPLRNMSIEVIEEEHASMLWSFLFRKHRVLLVKLSNFHSSINVNSGFWLEKYTDAKILQDEAQNLSQ